MIYPLEKTKISYRMCGGSGATLCYMFAIALAGPRSPSYRGQRVWLRFAWLRLNALQYQLQLCYHMGGGPYAFTGSHKSSRSTCTEFIVPYRVHLGRPIIRTGVNTYYTTVNFWNHEQNTNYLLNVMLPCTFRTTSKGCGLYGERIAVR